MKSEQIQPIEQPEAESNTLEETVDSDQDLRQFTKDYSPLARAELVAKIRIARLRKELGITDKEEELSIVHKLQQEFKNRFAKQKETFDKEKESTRDVETISREKNIIFVHTVPLDSFDGEANTQMNNQVVRTNKMRTMERIGMITNEHPTISCSSIKIDAPKAYGHTSSKSMYPFGVVIGEGTVMSAHLYDGGISTISKTARHRKYDKHDKDSTIQPNIGAQIEHATNAPFSDDYMRKFEGKHGHIDTGSNILGGNYNDISVADPKVKGFFVDADFTYARSVYEIKDIRFDEKREGYRWKAMYKIFAEYPGVPIYIREHNQVKEYILSGEDLIEVNNQTSKKDEKTITLEDYVLPHPSHAFFEVGVLTKTEAKESGTYLFNLKNLGPIADTLTSIKYHFSHWRYTKNTGKVLAELLKEHPGKEHAVLEAALKDFSESMQELQTLQTELKQRAATENRHTMLDKGSTLYDLRVNQTILIKSGFEGFIEEFEAAGFVDISSKMREVLNS